MDKKERFQIALLPIAIYFLIRALLEPENFLSYHGIYEVHVLAISFSLLIFPAVYIYLKNQELRILCCKKAFILGFIAYLPFLPLFLFLFGPVLGASGKGLDLLKLLFLMCINVSAVDFYVWRIWQESFGRIFGLLAWILIHFPESSLLIQFGIEKVAFFMLLSGITFSEVYKRYKCVGGLMTGHVAINVGMALIRGEWW